MTALQDGYVGHMDTEGCGIASVLLKAGRSTKEDVIDNSAGIILHKKYGDYVQKGDVYKRQLLIPEGEENIMYNWMLNFQYMSDEYVKMYKNSKPVGDGKEADIYIFSDPQWNGSDRPNVSLDCLSDPQKKTLCYFNTETNCACIPVSYTHLDVYKRQGSYE